jgi:hypothetical protein
LIARSHAGEMIALGEVEIRRLDGLLGTIGGFD